MAKEYLGDGVYATFDGYQIWLHTMEGMQIALDPGVMVSLMDYRKRLHESLRKSTDERDADPAKAIKP